MFNLAFLAQALTSFLHRLFQLTIAPIAPLFRGSYIEARQKERDSLYDYFEL